MALSRVKQEHPEYGSLLLTMENMEDADWENNWKQFISLWRSVTGSSSFRSGRAPVTRRAGWPCC